MFHNCDTSILSCLLLQHFDPVKIYYYETSIL